MTATTSDAQPRRVLYRKIILWVAIAGLIYGTYLLAGVYLVPRLIRWQATEWVKTNLGKPIAIGEIKFDPFRFRARIDDVAIPGPVQPMVAVGRLEVDFSFLSLFQSAYRLDELGIERPFVRAIVRPDGSLNLLELIPPSHPESESPAFRIDTLRVDQGRVAFADRSRELKPEKTLAPITFTLRDFRTKSSEGGAFTFNATSERNEHFAWRGTVSMAPIASRGNFTIANLRSDTIYKFLSESLPVELTDGTIGADGSYGFRYDKDGMRLNLALPKLTLSNFAFNGKNGILRGAVHADAIDANVSRLNVAAGGRNAITASAVMPRLMLRNLRVSGAGPAAGQDIRLTELLLDNTSLDMAPHLVSIGALTLGGLDVKLMREKNGTLGLMKLFAPSAPSGSAPPAPWNVQLTSFALKEAALHVEDRSVAPAARFDLAPISLTATGAGTDLTKAVGLEFSTGINAKGVLKGSGTVTPATHEADIKFSLDGLPLPALASYLLPYPALRLKSGTLGASGALTVSGGGKPELRFKGSSVVRNFELAERANNSILLAWRGLQLSGVDYRPGRLDIGQGVLSRPFGRIAVLPDRTFNFTALMTPQTAVPAPAAAPSQTPPQVRMKTLRIDNGTLSFADYSMTPNFEARIEALTGSVGNITSQPDAVAAIDLKGQVIDRFSPVTIAGTANLFGYDRSTNIQAAFRNIELPVFNPYSGRYAGYAIAKGKLTTLLDYKIVDRALVADHHLIIDQLEWGQATDSKDKVPWPVGLVTSLLKDRHGVIDLDIPVKGTLDDPTFRLGPIIWQIIGNLVEKIIVAPFSLIGSLFEGAEKAQFVDFAPGSAVLPAGSTEGLSALSKGLADRPGLQLDIPAGPAGREDAVFIADTRINALLMTDEIKKGQPADPAKLDPDDQHNRLESLYRTKFGKRPAFPEALPAPATDGKQAAAQPDPDLVQEKNEILWMRTELQKSFLPSNAELAALGSARATAVRDVLLAKGDIDPGRVFMVTGQTATASGALERVELKLR